MFLSVSDSYAEGSFFVLWVDAEAERCYRIFIIGITYALSLSPMEKPA